MKKSIKFLMFFSLILVPILAQPLLSEEKKPSPSVSYSNVEKSHITGPVVIPLTQITASRPFTAPSQPRKITKETLIHLPDSVNYVMVENQSYSTKLFEQELRAYTWQQGLFWIAATWLLAAAVNQ
ncbi:hypothetical protein ACFL96_16595 [Thermoproteota archaeon]